jgi:hypothetical protein
MLYASPTWGVKVYGRASVNFKPYIGCSVPVAESVPKFPEGGLVFFKDLQNAIALIYKMQLQWFRNTHPCRMLALTHNCSYDTLQMGNFIVVRNL